MKAPHPNHLRGFTLVELSVVLVIIALILSGGLSILLAALSQRQYDETADRMKVIQSTLSDYRKAYGRIPCPGSATAAATASSFGVEGTAGSCATATFTDGSNTRGGLVPTKTLGLSADYAFDGWGHRFLYVTDIRFTATNAFTTYRINDLTGAITIKESTGTTITASGIEALISFGANGHGAYSYSGTRMYGDGSTNANEWENCGCNATVATTFNSTFVQQLPYQNPSTTTDAFDDIVLYKTRATLRSAIEPIVPSDLTIAKSHSGTWTQGQTGKTYSITVSNAVGAGATSGTVTVVDTLPAGLTATAISGTGWTCILGTLTCTRSDALIAGSSYPVITVTVSISGGAGTPLTNTAVVSGGGETNSANDTATDSTVITAANTPDMTITKTHSGTWTQNDSGDVYTITVSNAGTASSSGTVTVVDTLPSGLTATAMSGSGWSCVVGTLTCTRSDALAASGSYPAISLTVSVSGSAGTPLTNSVTVSGGGESNVGNDTATDSTAIAVYVPPPGNYYITIGTSNACVMWNWVSECVYYCVDGGGNAQNNHAYYWQAGTTHWVCGVDSTTCTNCWQYTTPSHDDTIVAW